MAFVYVLNNLLIDTSGSCLKVQSISEGSPNGMAAVLKTAVPKGTWGFKSLTLRIDVHRGALRWDSQIDDDRSARERVVVPFGQFGTEGGFV